MTRNEYLDQIERKKIDDSKVKKIESIYKSELSELLKKIVSNSAETEFLDDGIRILSFDEIVDAEKDLHVNFKDLGILPIADCGENDFIVYHFAKDTWSKFNILDEICFKEKNELKELL